MNINRVSYEILENSISLYLSFSDDKEEDIILRILGDKESSSSNIEEYLNNSKNDSSYGYKIYILINPYIKNNNFYDKSIVTTEEKIRQADIKFNKVLEEFIEKINIVKTINPSKEIDEFSNELTVFYNGFLTSKGDLIAHIVNSLLEQKISITQENHLNSKDENQLCRKI